MLTKFDIILECEKDFANRNMGSLFHGVLMELLPPHYVKRLHENTLKPFSQYVLPCEEGIKWSLCGLNKEAAEYINAALMGGIDTINLKNKDRTFNILSRTMSNISYKNFIDKTYFGEPSDFVKICFNTPTAFKTDGRYIIYPDMASIYKNLIRKFDAFSTEFSLYDDDTIESLINHSIITSYKLQSTSYSMESIRIPSYTGWINVKINASQQLSNLAKLLLCFGEYSGIGIKTALGMGAVKTEDVSRRGKR